MKLEEEIHVDDEAYELMDFDQGDNWKLKPSSVVLISDEVLILRIKPETWNYLELKIWFKYHQIFVCCSKKGLM
jgi:hypothetical protein